MSNHYVTKMRAITPMDESVETMDTRTGGFRQKSSGIPQILPMDVLEDRYQITACVGRGGMGAVYCAKDLRLQRYVAIKVLCHADSKAIARFMREVQTLASLKCPHLPTVYDRGKHGEHSFLVMEFVEGKSLSRLLSEQGPMQPAGAARVLGDVLVALDCMHAKGLVHRDVKPANVVVSNNDRGTLVDLGVVWSSSDDSITSSGVIVGTPVYMSPEQYNSDPVDARTDLYSAGILLYCMLTGQLITHGGFELVGEVYRRQCHALPSPWAEIVYRALEPHPSARFASAIAMRDAVFAAVNGTTGDYPIISHAHAPAPAVAYPSDVSTLPRSHRLVTTTGY